VKIPVKLDPYHISKSLNINILDLEARVGIERFMLCFPKEFSHQTVDSQGYSATTRLNPILLVHYSATEEFTEGTAATPCLVRNARNRLVGWQGMPGPDFVHRAG
jgi:hypothetical protein